MRPQPVAIMGGIPELEARVKAGHHDFAIMLAGGAAISRKTIDLKRVKTAGPIPIVSQQWLVKNHIDGTKQTLTTAALWTQSNIGEALDKNALLDMEGDLS